MCLKLIYSNILTMFNNFKLIISKLVLLKSKMKGALDWLGNRMPLFPINSTVRSGTPSWNTWTKDYDSSSCGALVHNYILWKMKLSQQIWQKGKELEFSFVWGMLIGNLLSACVVLHWLALVQLKSQCYGWNRMWHIILIIWVWWKYQVNAWMGFLSLGHIHNWIGMFLYFICLVY